MKTQMAVLAAALGLAAVLASADVANPPVDRRVGALEARVTALERQVGDLTAAVTALQRRPGGAAVDGPVPVTTIGEETASVKEVLDGATMNLEDGRVLRLVGIDPTGAEREAAAFLRYLVQGKSVRVEYDGVRRDADGRILAYAYAGDRCVNAELVKAGYAKAVPARLNPRHAAELVDLERDAREHKRGMWGSEKH